MRKRALVVLSLLLIVLANETRARACTCVAPGVDKAFQTSASIFVGEVMQISGPLDVEIGSNVEQLHRVKFFVWERWKGPKAFEVEILSPQKQRSCFDRPPMEIGETYLIFADPVSVKNGSPQIQGHVTSCTLTTLFIGAGPQPKIRLDALATIFLLDKLTGPAPPQRTPAFGRKEIHTKLCAFCRDPPKG